MSFLEGNVYYMGALGLVFVGLLVILVRHNLIKMIIGLSIMDTGVNLFLVAVGYSGGGTAPIFGRAASDPAAMVDPVPQALVLTAIVIGVAVLALALAMAVRLHGHHGTLDMRKIRELRW